MSLTSTELIVARYQRILPSCPPTNCDADEFQDWLKTLDVTQIDQVEVNEASDYLGANVIGFQGPCSHPHYQPVENRYVGRTGDFNVTHHELVFDL